jgi:flavin reductase
MIEPNRVPQTLPVEAPRVNGGRYRAAMARLAGAVHLVTTAGEAGRAGFTASAVCSVSDAPPTLLVCLNRASSAYPVFARSEVLCVNTLSARQGEVASVFGGKTGMDERFAAGTWARAITGAPVLEDALVSFDCRIVGRTPVGTHDVLFCAIEAIVEGRDAGRDEGCLIYADRRYRSLAQEPPLSHRAA